MMNPYVALYYAAVKKLCEINARKDFSSAGEGEFEAQLEECRALKIKMCDYEREHYTGLVVMLEQSPS